MALPFRIVISPRADRPGLFEARLGDELLCVSSTPFLSAARVLAGRGHGADTPLVMRHSGSGIDSLRSSVGTAAALTVVERDRKPIKFERWRPLKRVIDAAGVAANLALLIAGAVAVHHMLGGIIE